MLRRLLLALVTSAALMLSAGIGFLAADWPFLHRLWQLTPDGTGWRAPAQAPVEAFGGPATAFFPVATPARRTIDAGALAQAEAWAAANDSAALLVLHRGEVQLERYWQGLTRETPYPMRGFSPSLLGLAYGRAVAEGRVPSLDVRVEHWLEEWRGEPRGEITLRQLLGNVSGLEPARLDDWIALFGKSGRLRFGTRTGRAALAFDLAHEPGTHFAVSPVDAQLLGVILERATGEPYPRFIAQALWQPIGAGVAEIRLDRRGGMAAVFDGLRAAPGDLLRLGAFLADEGVVAGRPMLPPGWIGELARGSVPNPHQGLDARGLDGGGVSLAGDGRIVWAWPGERLVVVRLGRATPGWDADTLPRLLRGAVR
ncbi:MAG: serine hydrolase domain-containing protein [Steroidobacteraceae bacterium]